MIYHDAPQGSDAWLQSRKGCITGSRFKDARDKLKKLDGISEDDKKHAEKDLQKLHDDTIGKLDALLKAKEAEVMEV